MIKHEMNIFLIIAAGYFSKVALNRYLNTVLFLEKNINYAKVKLL
jgi:hypothetical protein